MPECVVAVSVAAMVLIGQPFEFRNDDPRPMLRHLDTWARRHLTSPESWASMAERCEQWLDYSARNQVLLASYGVVGPVAGAATWGLVPSVDAGRGCAVRAGEHGLPVRIPIVDGVEVASDRSRLGATSASVATSHRWELVFAEEQLIRRPASGTLAQPVPPRLSEQKWNEAVRVAPGRMLGRTPRRIDSAPEQLALLASKVPPGAGRVALAGALVEQAGWLASDRVGMASGAFPAFDPTGLTGRERWRTLVDVRHASSRLVDAVSFAVEDHTTVFALLEERRANLVAQRVRALNKIHALTRDMIPRGARTALTAAVAMAALRRLLADERRAAHPAEELPCAA